MPDEMTNQSVESTETEPTTSSDDWDLFSDDEEVVDTPVESEVEETPTETQAEPESFMTIKYNGAEQKLTQEQAITLAQKGMNYDKVFGELQSLKNSQEMQILNELAKSSGVSVSQYMQSLLTFQNNAMLQKYADNLRGKYPDAPDELINEMAKIQFEKANVDKNNLEMVTAKSAEKEQTDKLVKQINALTAEFPEVDINNLPDEVIEMAAQGETLLGAYRAFELKQLREKYKSLETEKSTILKNQDNKRKATGSLSNKAGGESVDIFLEGFNF